MGEIIIEESNYRAFALVVANLFMLIAFIAISAYGLTRHRMAYWLPGFIAGGVFFIGFLIAISKAMKEKKLLTITIDGVVDETSLSGYGFISFDDIKEFRIITQYRTRFIAIILKDLNHFLNKLPPAKRRQLKRSIIMKQPPVAINVEMAKDMEPEDILSLLQKRLADYSCLYD